ncbi:hypothetical protein Tco_0096892 [Tanacetum coccineum]
MPKSAWIEKDQIDNFLKERRSNLFDESDTHVLERFNASAGNPVKEIILKLNLPDHRILKDGGEAISGHMFGAVGVQIPKNNLDDLHSSREEDGTLETIDPQD